MYFVIGNSIILTWESKDKQSNFSITFKQVTKKLKGPCQLINLWPENKRSQIFVLDKQRVWKDLFNFTNVSYFKLRNMARQKAVIRVNILKRIEYIGMTYIHILLHVIVQWDLFLMHVNWILVISVEYLDRENVIQNTCYTYIDDCSLKHALLYKTLFYANRNFKLLCM